MSKYNKLRKPRHYGFKNKTRGGHQALILRDDSPDPVYPIVGVIIKKDRTVICSSWPLDGLYTNGQDTAFDLIPLKDKKAHFDDLTKIDVPFGELDKDTQERLKAWPHGVDFKAPPSWFKVAHPEFANHDIYRALPEPTENPKTEYELDRWYPWNGGECPVPNKAKTSILFGLDGIRTDCDPKGWNWGKTQTGNDILAFKVVSYA